MKTFLIEKKEKYNEKHEKRETRGGTTPLGRNSKVLGGIVWEKLLSYYGTKALRGNINVGRHYQADRKIYTPHFTHAIHVKKAAFTLAEVLITLGIIGIVAAMTIPTLISNYQKKTYVVGLKKAYSILQQSFKMMLVNSDCLSLTCLGWGSSLDAVDGRSFTDTNTRNMYLLFKQFKGAHWLDECIYTTYYSSVDNSLKNENYNLCTNGGFAGADGVLYAMQNSQIYVDVNGIEKGPGNLGRDIFVFYIDSEKAMVYPRAGWDLGKGYCMTDMSKPQAVWGSYCTKRVLDENAMNY